MSTFDICAPINGWATPLSEVPDPAFAEKMVGDGIAIDPLAETVVAPFNGTVVSIHRARHACILRADNGVDLLIHIGVDTVTLNGEGFTAHVQDGARIALGDKLISFDMAKVSGLAKSMQVIVLSTDMDKFPVLDRVENREVTAGEMIFSVAAEAPVAAASTAEAASTGAFERSVVVTMSNGFHARPATVFASAAKSFAGKVEVRCHDRSGNGKSLVGLMGLGIRHGDTLTIVTSGAADAAAKADELAAAVEAGLGDPTTPVGTIVRPVENTVPVMPVTSSTEPFTAGEEVLLTGVIAAPGSVVGTAKRFAAAEYTLVEAGAGLDAEKTRLATALSNAREAIMRESGTGTKEQKAIFAAHAALLEDPEMTGIANDFITRGKSAAWAWHQATEQQASVLAAAGDTLIRERIADLRDVERRVLDGILGKSSAAKPELAPGTIIVAEDLLPSDFTALAEAGVAGLVTARGGPTAHVSILAASAGIPMVVAIGGDALRIPDHAPLILNANRGEVRVFADDAAIAEARAAIAEGAARHARHVADAAQECHLADGVRIEVFANLGRPGDGAVAVANGAEGCGLLRSEFLFLDRATAPSEDEQNAHYQEALDTLGGRPLVIRTLDVGGDKPLPYLPLPPEDNPILGLRGVRVSLRYPEVLREQVRAILRVKPLSKARILLPMVNSPEDIRAVKKVIDEEKAALGMTEPVEVGAMIEVPAAALMADKLAAEADFLSIGTNDLTQYVLAMDRGNPLLASQLDALEPGVLRLIGQTVEGANRFKKPVAVCGGAASDPASALILVGLGVSELSAAPATIPELKATLRTMTLAQCQALAQEAINQETAAAVRILLQHFMANKPV